MKLQLKLSIRGLFVAIVYQMLFAGQLLASGTSFDVDLKRATISAKSDHKIMILYFSASYCSYCKELTADVINIVKSHNDYRPKVVLKEIVIDEQMTIKDFKGESIDASTLQMQQKITATPTLIFVDEHGNEIAERLEGYHSKDFYWYYLDKSIANALATLD